MEPSVLMLMNQHIDIMKRTSSTESVSATRYQMIEKVQKIFIAIDGGFKDNR